MSDYCQRCVELDASLSKMNDNYETIRDKWHSARERLAASEAALERQRDATQSSIRGENMAVAKLRSSEAARARLREALVLLDQESVEVLADDGSSWTAADNEAWRRARAALAADGELNP